MANPKRKYGETHAENFLENLMDSLSYMRGAFGYRFKRGAGLRRLYTADCDSWREGTRLDTHWDNPQLISPWLCSVKFREQPHQDESLPEGG